MSHTKSPPTLDGGGDRCQSALKKRRPVRASATFFFRMSIKELDLAAIRADDRGEFLAMGFSKAEALDAHVGDHVMAAGGVHIPIDAGLALGALDDGEHRRIVALSR